jgi:hypothetical protein
LNTPAIRQETNRTFKVKHHDPADASPAAFSATIAYAPMAVDLFLSDYTDIFLDSKSK